MNTNASDTLPPIPPKHFWKRVFAYLIDLIIVGIGFTILALVMNLVLPFKVVGPSLINAHKCELANILNAEQVEQVMPTRKG